MKKMISSLSVLALFLALGAGAIRAQDEMTDEAKPESVSDKKQDAEPKKAGDVELQKWIDTLIAQVKKEHKVIRASAAQGLIGAGAPALAKVEALSKTAQGDLRKTLGDVTRQIRRGEERRKAQEARKPSALADEWGKKLKLDDEKKAGLLEVLKRAEARNTELRDQMRDGEADRREIMMEMREAREDLLDDLQDFMKEDEAKALVRKMGGGGRGGGRFGQGRRGRGDRGNRGGGQGGRDL